MLSLDHEKSQSPQQTRNLPVGPRNCLDSTETSQISHPLLQESYSLLMTLLQRSSPFNRWLTTIVVKSQVNHLFRRTYCLKVADDVYVADKMKQERKAVHGTRASPPTRGATNTMIFSGNVPVYDIQARASVRQATIEHDIRKGR